jgi:hypothetical protein
VSDVIVVRKRGKRIAYYYVYNLDFKPLENFEKSNARELENRDDL